MGRKTKALKSAISHTVPIFAGFIFLGIAYGILMSSKGYNMWWSTAISFIIYAGSVQYVGAVLLTSAFNPVYAFFMALMVNARNIFYGIAMLEKYKGTGKLKPYLIFGLVDESFSLNYSAKAPEGVDENLLLFFITMLSHLYWVVGTFLGGLLGEAVSFNTNGLDFVLTALFVVIFVNQLKDKRSHLTSAIGVGCTALCLLIFGAEKFIIPSMALITTILLLFKTKISKGDA